jgi:hypothetical protein
MAEFLVNDIGIRFDQQEDINAGIGNVTTIWVSRPDQLVRTDLSTHMPASVILPNYVADTQTATPLSSLDEQSTISSPREADEYDQNIWQNLSSRLKVIEELRLINELNSVLVRFPAQKHGDWLSISRGSSGSTISSSPLHSHLLSRTMINLLRSDDDVLNCLGPLSDSPKSPYIKLYRLHE